MLSRGQGGHGPAMGQHGEAAPLRHLAQQAGEGAVRLRGAHHTTGCVAGRPRPRFGHGFKVVGFTILGSNGLPRQALVLPAYSSTTPWACWRCSSRSARLEVFSLF